MSGEHMEMERRETVRRKCDQHDACVAEYTAEIKQIHGKIKQLCDMYKGLAGHGDRLTAAEHKIVSHGERIKEEKVWRNGHEQFKTDSLEKQAARDDAMQGEINELALAMKDLANTITTTEGRLMDYFSRKLLAVAGVAIVTCLGAVGAFTMALVNFWLTRGV